MIRGVEEAVHVRLAVSVVDENSFPDMVRQSVQADEYFSDLLLIPQKQLGTFAASDSLINLRKQVMNGASETERLSRNEDFMYLMENVLQMDGSFKFPWDSVKNFSVVASPDKLFKIYTWYVIKDDYSYENFGFLQVYNASRKHYDVIPLYDKR